MRSAARALAFASLAAGICAASPALAAGGVREINQAAALAGGVTPGDTPGFPVTLSVAGAYALTGALTPPAATGATSAISITANDVSIDLNGFRIEGPVTGCPAACAPAGAGNGVSGVGRSNVTVRNGTVRGFGGNGVALGNEARVDRVHVADNGDDGIEVGSGSLVSSCIARSNGDAGLYAGVTSSVVMRGNVVHDNGGDGIEAGYGSTLAGNVVYENAGNGITTQSGSTVSDNVVSANGTVLVDGDGIQVGADSHVLRNAVRANEAYGVQGGASSDQAFGLSGNVIAGNFALVGASAPCYQVAGEIVVTGSNSCAGDIQCPPASCLPAPPPVCPDIDDVLCAPQDVICRALANAAAGQAFQNITVGFCVVDGQAVPCL